MEFIRKGIIRKRLENFELKTFESIASEITINKQKYFLLSFYRTERKENRGKNIKRFINELSDILTKVYSKYDNVILMGDINIDLDDMKCQGFKEFSNFMDIFSLSNLIKEKTCFFKNHDSLIDVFLTNSPRKFKKSFSLELGISDCHKIIGSFLKTTISTLKQKMISYRSLKNLDIELFN